jgi:biotin carboxylase
MIRAVLIGLSFAMTACATPGHAGDGHHSSQDEPRPFEKDRDANADVDAALLRATERGTKALIVMGGNWCHDSRGFAAAIAEPETATLIAENYELVWVNVGMKVLNQDVAERFGLDGTPGTPTVIVATGDGTILNLEDAPTWRNAASRDQKDIHQYFVDMAAKE